MMTLSPTEFSPEQAVLVQAELALRDQARGLALRLHLDESDVLHQLKQLRRTPMERLKMGLAHGRQRGRLLK